jgi:diaminopimelate decarboxylase
MAPETRMWPQRIEELSPVNQFHYQNQQLYCEQIALAEVAHTVGTPFYAYSQASLLARATAYQTSLSEAQSLVCYAVKANGNPAIIRLLGQAGLGADVTSGGELFLAQHAGIPSHKIIFSGVGKTRSEIDMALQANIRALHVESEMELEVIAEVAKKQEQVAAIGVRVNPDIHADTHPYISTGTQAHKFGVTPETAVRLLHFASKNPWLSPIGLATHIGSQITTLEPFVQAAEFLVTMADELGLPLEYVDIGGGLGIDYAKISAPQIGEWVTAVSTPILKAGYNLVMEPGRSLVGPSGALITKVNYIKQQGEKRFLIVDAGMSDLIRPTLYDAYHPVWPLIETPPATEAFDIVGPICETGDWLARDRRLLVNLGDFVAILQAGAYGFAMSSNYNGRLRPAEVLIHGDQFQLIRQRQTYEHLLDGCDYQA